MLNGYTTRGYTATRKELNMKEESSIETTRDYGLDDPPPYCSRPLHPGPIEHN